MPANKDAKGSKVVYTYTPRNEGDVIPGVPARDLTQEDLDQLSPDLLREVEAPDNPTQTVYTKAGEEPPPADVPVPVEVPEEAPAEEAPEAPAAAEEPA